MSKETKISECDKIVTPTKNERIPIFKQLSSSSVRISTGGANIHIRSTTTISSSSPSRNFTEANLPNHVCEPKEESCKAENSCTAGISQKQCTSEVPTQLEIDGKKLERLSLVEKKEKQRFGQSEKPPASEDSVHSSDASSDFGTDSFATHRTPRKRRITTSKSGKLIIASEHQPVVSREKISNSESSSKHSGSDMRRSSLGWNKRVSINTPIRRKSEHEVSWVDSSDADLSPQASEPEDDLESRASIIVNLNDKGRKRSFSLAKVETEMREYLAELQADVTANTESTINSLDKATVD